MRRHQKTLPVFAGPPEMRGASSLPAASAETSALPATSGTFAAAANSRDRPLTALRKRRIFPVKPACGEVSTPLARKGRFSVPGGLRAWPGADTAGCGPKKPPQNQTQTARNWAMSVAGLPTSDFSHPPSPSPIRCPVLSGHPKFSQVRGLRRQLKFSEPADGFGTVSFREQGRPRPHARTAQKMAGGPPSVCERLLCNWSAGFNIQLFFHSVPGSESRLRAPAWKPPGRTRRLTREFIQLGQGVPGLAQQLPQLPALFLGLGGMAPMLPGVPVAPGRARALAAVEPALTVGHGRLSARLPRPLGPSRALPDRRQVEAARRRFVPQVLADMGLIRCFHACPPPPGESG